MLFCSDICVVRWVLENLLRKWQTSNKFYYFIAHGVYLEICKKRCTHIPANRVSVLRKRTINGFVYIDARTIIAPSQVFAAYIRLFVYMINMSKENLFKLHFCSLNKLRVCYTHTHEYDLGY